MRSDVGENELRRLANQRLGWPACAGCGTALTHDDTSAECNRCVTTDPDRQVAELRARVAYLEGRLADERAAHAKTQELAGVWPSAGLSAALLTDGERAEFLRVATEHLRLAEERGPTDLSVEQKIHVHALALYFHDHNPGWALGDVLGWIRDGSVPGEPT